MVVHLEDPADDRRVAAPGAQPVRMAEDQHRLGAWLVVVGREGAAEERPGAEHAEEVGRDDAGLHAFGLAAAEEVEPHRVVLGETGEGVLAPPQVLDVRHREPLLLVGVERQALVEHHQPVGLAVRQLVQQDATHDAEDRRVGADAQGERRHHRAGVARVPAQQAEREAHVLAQRLQPPVAARRAGRFLGRLEAAQLQRGAACRLLGRGALAQLRRRLHGEVEAQLLVELGLQAAALEETADGGESAADGGHRGHRRFLSLGHWLHAVRSTRATASTKRSQLSVSRSSWRLPARVR